MRKFLCVFFFLTSLFLFSQKPVFWEDIQAFAKQDSLSSPPKNCILLVGSSSFTNWKDAQSYFPEEKMLNRGFGGSTLKDVIFYQKEVIFKYQPKLIFIYCGENDFVMDEKTTPKMVLKRFKTLYKNIRSWNKSIPLVYISLKPSPSRWYLKSQFTRLNRLIENFISKQKNIRFLNVWNKMLNDNGQAQPEIFLEDQLHMNAKGYAIWAEEMRKYTQ